MTGLRSLRSVPCDIIIRCCLLSLYGLPLTGCGLLRRGSKPRLSSENALHFLQVFHLAQTFNNHLHLVAVVYAQFDGAVEDAVVA